MRYALMPDDGNHLGVAPNRDFLLLVRAADDPDPAAVFKFADLVGFKQEGYGEQPSRRIRSDGVQGRIGANAR